MAYDNLRFGKLNFQLDGIPKIVRIYNSFGLLKSAVFCMADGGSKVLSFLCLGVQEYLAACHIVDFDDSQIATLLQKSFMSNYKWGEVRGMSLMFTNVWPLFCRIKFTSDNFHTTVTTAVKEITQQASTNQEVIITAFFEDPLKYLCMLLCCLEVNSDHSSWIFALMEIAHLLT